MQVRLKQISLIFLSLYSLTIFAANYQFLGIHDGGADYIDVDSVRPLGTNLQFMMATVFQVPQNLGFSEPVSSIVVSTALDCKKGSYFSGTLYAYNDTKKLIGKTNTDRWFVISPTSVMEKIYLERCK